MLGAVWRFFKDQAGQAAQDRALAEYYRIEYINNPDQFPYKLPAAIQRIRIQDRWGNWYYREYTSQDIGKYRR